MATPKHRAEHGLAMTRRDYDLFCERKGHVPYWPPVHSHTDNVARMNQKDTKSTGANQVPPHRSNHT